ncbi:Tyrosinase ustQ [Paramyrothecium foliicola]|nr:Tyrosinase ustQ [Paramyrothecium foliicola]
MGAPDDSTLSIALTCMASFLHTVNALPSADLDARQKTCVSPRLRKSWNAASAAEKKAYINAAVCLTKKPSKLTGVPGATRHEDFTWVHNKFANQIHGTANFLPWHRYIIHVYEQALVKECGYTGTALYWDFVADSASPILATIWDPITGFGGNGTSTDGTPLSFCVREGPFAHMKLQFLGNETIPHCLNRDFIEGYPYEDEQELLGGVYSPKFVNPIMALPDFLNFHARLEGGPHSGVHIGISGDMGPVTSPNDPIFYLVHAQVDRLWWIWQQESPSRLSDYAGNVWPEDYTGMSASLDDMLLMGGLAKDKKVRDFMDTAGSELCYKY